jgi:hypothetical protein
MTAKMQPFWWFKATPWYPKVITTLFIEYWNFGPPSEIPLLHSEDWNYPDPPTYTLLHSEAWSS